MRFIGLLLVTACLMLGQQIDYIQGVKNKPAGPTLPVKCAVGAVYEVTSTPPINYVCYTLDTWTRIQTQPLEDTVISRSAIGMWDMVTKSDSTHYTDFSGYGNHFAVNGGITQKTYGIDGDGNTGSYLEVNNAALKPTPYTSGSELSTNGNFSGGSLSGWTCTGGPCVSSTNYITIPGVATYLGYSVKLQGNSPVSSFYQNIPVLPNTVYRVGYWASTGTSGVGGQISVTNKAPDNTGTVDGAAGTLTWTGGNDDYSNQSRLNILIPGDIITVNGSACTVLIAINSITITVSGSGCTGTLSAATYISIGKTSPIATGVGSTVMVADTRWQYPSFMFITPANCTFIQVLFNSPSDGTDLYLTKFSVTRNVPMTIGALFRRNGIITGARQYLFTELFDLEDMGVGNIQANRIWALDFDNGSGNLQLHNETSGGQVGSDSILTSLNHIPYPAQGDWHYVVVSLSSIPDYQVGTAYYRQSASMWMDGILTNKYSYPTTSQPIFPDYGVVPLRLFATDATGNEHNLLGSAAFAHVNRAEWSDFDALNAAGCMHNLLISRGQTPWSGTSNCPVGGNNLIGGLGVTIKDGIVNIGQDISPTKVPIFAGISLTGSSTAMFAPNTAALTPLHVFGRVGGVIQGNIAYNGADNTIVFGPTSDSRGGLIANSTTRYLTWGFSLLTSEILHTFNAGTTSLSAPVTSANTPIHTFGRFLGGVQGNISYAGADNTLEIGSTTGNQFCIKGNAVRGFCTNGTTNDVKLPMAFVQYLYANLPASPANGWLVYCGDCKNVTDDTTGTFDSVAASGGNGTLLLREHGQWRVH